MTTSEILGWAKTILDTFGLTGFITAFLVIGIAAALLKRFLDR